MVYFVMNDHKNLKWPSIEQFSIDVIIIVMCLLHIHMLEILQLLCNKRFGPNCKCILKVLRHLPFEITRKLVTTSYYNVLTKQILAYLHSIWKMNVPPTNLLTNCIYIQQKVFHFSSLKWKFQDRLLIVKKNLNTNMNPSIY